MCGINGIFAYGGGAPPVDRGELLASRECMRSRGTDTADVWVSADGRVGLGHRRLAIIDLSPAGAQPMRRGERVIIFNGEIYNYRELRARLEAKGRTFTSHSDTEVLLQLYDELGEGMLGGCWVVRNRKRARGVACAIAPPSKPLHPRSAAAADG